MRSLKIIFHVLILVGMILLAAGLAAAQETRPRLAQVIYITKSEDCGCDNKRYMNADAAVDHVFAGPGANCSNVSTTPRSTRQPCLISGSTA